MLYQNYFARSAVKNLTCTATKQKLAFEWSGYWQVQTAYGYLYAAGYPTQRTYVRSQTIQ